jgi:MFS family permease
MEKNRSHVLGLVVWGCAAFFYGFQFILRVSPSVISHDLMRDLHLDACLLGALSSFYYIGYSAMQIPSGIILDRLGPRRPLTVACLLCAGGAFLFSYAESLTLLSVARTFMGIGSAFAFLSCVKLASLYFPPRILSILVGFTMTVGTLGATAGGAPLGMLVDASGWRMANTVLGFVSLVIAVAAFLVIRENAQHTTNEEERAGETLVQSLILIAKNPQTWIYGLYGFAMYVPLSGFADLWGTPFVMEAYKMDRTAAAGTMSLFYVGLSIGAPTWSYYATRVQSYRMAMMYSALASVLCLTLVLYVHVPVYALYGLMMLAGFAVGGQFIAFAGVTALNPLYRTGTASGMHNMLCMISGIAMQPLLGHFLDLCQKADPTCMGVIGCYTKEHYLKSLAIIPLTLIFALVITVFMKDTFPKEDAPKASS